MMSAARTLRAAVYARVSDPKQEQGASLDTQVEAALAYAASQGWQVAADHVYREIHTGDELLERQVLGTVRELARLKTIDILLCYAVDRLTRNQAHLYILADEFERHGARLEFVTETFEDNPVGRFILSAKTFAAEVERQKIIERTYRGTLARARSGKPLAGPHPPYGYRWNADKSAYLADPSAAPVVQRIFQEASLGRTLRAIAIDLGKDGIGSPGGKPYWHFTTVRLILRNRMYIGEAFALRTKTVKLKGGGYRMTRRPEQEHIPLPAGVVPALIELAVFEAVQERLRLNQERAVRNAKTPENALLRAGFIRCGHCNRSMGVDTQQGRSIPFYRCTRNDHVGGCRGMKIRLPEADSFVWERVEAVLLNPDIVAEQLARLQAGDSTERDLAQLEQAIAVVRKQQERAAQAVLHLEEDAAQPLVQQLKELANRRRVLEAERESVLGRRAGWVAAQGRMDQVRALCQAIAATLTTLTYQERRMALDALGVRVKAYRPEHSPRLVVEMDLALESDVALTGASA